MGEMSVYNNITEIITINNLNIYCENDIYVMNNNNEIAVDAIDS